MSSPESKATTPPTSPEIPSSTGLGLVAYSSAVAAHVYGGYALGLLGGSPPLGVQSSTTSSSAIVGACVTDAFLLLLFGVQHSGMAREAVKQKLTGGSAPSSRAAFAFRAFYVISSSVVFFVMLAAWRPLPFELWRFDHGPIRWVLLTLAWIGLVILVAASFAHDHSALFGLRPSKQEQSLSTPQLYRLVRHPMMTGLLMVLWSTPDMTGGRALLACGLTGYIVLGVFFEERDLERRFGTPFSVYRKKVGRFLPRVAR
jgi:protein-S-isoprenylcysteine O-methyltransferase Ste14